MWKRWIILALLTAGVVISYIDRTNFSVVLVMKEFQRDFHITQLVQECAIPESQAMLISGHKTRAMLERYNIVSLKNVQDAGAKLDAWSKQHGIPAPVQVPTAS